MLRLRNVNFRLCFYLSNHQFYFVQTRGGPTDRFIHYYSAVDRPLSQNKLASVIDGPGGPWPVDNDKKKVQNNINL